jgi:hypothetical protein
MKAGKRFPYKRYGAGVVPTATPRKEGEAMGMKKMILMGVLLFSFPGLWTNPAYGADPLPADFPAITTHIYDANAIGEGYVFLAVADSVEGVGRYLMILKNDGTPVWYREVDTEEIYDFKVLPNGLLHYSPFIVPHSYAGGGDVIHG